MTSQPSRPTDESIRKATLEALAEVIADPAPRPLYTRGGKRGVFRSRSARGRAAADFCLQHGLLEKCSPESHDADHRPPLLDRTTPHEGDAETSSRDNAADRAAEGSQRRRNKARAITYRITPAAIAYVVEQTDAVTLIRDMLEALHSQRTALETLARDVVDELERVRREVREHVHQATHAAGIQAAILRQAADRLSPPDVDAVVARILHARD